MGSSISQLLPHPEVPQTVISKAKKADISSKHPFLIHFDINYYSFPLLAIKVFVFFCDIISTPFYALYMRPWAKRAANRKIFAKQEDPNDPYSAYVPVNAKPVMDHYVYKPETIPEFQQHALRFNPKNNPSLGRREIFNVTEVLSKSGKKMIKFHLDDKYTWLTLQQVDETIGQLSRAFLHQGVRFQEKVLIFAETRMEWFLCAQALFRIGSIVATLYATLGLEGIVYGIQETDVEHVITTEDLLPNLLKVIDRIPNVRHITVIQLHHELLLKQGKASQADFDAATKSDRKVQLTTYDQLLEIGKSTPEDKYQFTWPKPDDVAVILYTSGSTGNPKGVIQTHRNFIAELRSLYTLLDKNLLENTNQHRYYAFLPLAHTLEMVCELFYFNAGARLGYGSPYTMTDDGTAIASGQLGDLKILKPTLMAGVPLILDRIRKSLTNMLEGKSIFWTQLFKYACAYKNFWVGFGYDTPLVNRFVCKKVQAQLGGNVQYMFIGGAPLSPDTQRVMRAFLNIKLVIGYGSTETCGAVICTDLDDNSIGRIGGPISGQKVRLIDWPEGGYSVHDLPRPRGELVIGSKCITSGYFKLPELTKEAYEEIDGVRWFKMSDIAEVYPNGTFKIIDRKKDLVKLQFGEYVSLGKVEAELKNFKYVENVCVYGDSRRMFPIVLISPSIAALKRLAVELNKSSLSFEKLCKDSEIISRITRELFEFGLEAGLHKMEIPQKIKLCQEEWSVKTGFLTASMKINRQNIRKFYQADIDQMYAE